MVTDNEEQHLSGNLILATLVRKPCQICQTCQNLSGCRRENSRSVDDSYRISCRAILHVLQAHIKRSEQFRDAIHPLSCWRLYFRGACLGWIHYGNDRRD